MIFRTYFKKFNSIIKDSELNTGINPVAELVYGSSVSRMLIYFDTCHIKKLVDEKICPDISKFKHTLKITNAGSLDFTQIHCNEISSITDHLKIRAASFDLIFFLIPKFWDNGKGFDYTKTFFNQGYYGKQCTGTRLDSSRLLSVDGCNWYKARNGYLWDEEGIYSNLTLSKEYDKFSSEEGSSIIFARQHFDIGNENIYLDITDIFNKFMIGELENYGIGIAYAPMLELTEGKIEHYTGFLTNKTNTFFEPHIESFYDDYVSDDRNNFVLDKNNKLYLYCNIGGKTENLDELPTCEVEGKVYDVKQFSKGIYYIDINLSRHDFRPNTMLYDTWGNIIYQGVKLDDVELDFVVKSNAMHFNIGNSLETSNKLIPTIYGIDFQEKIKRGDLRKLVIKPRVEYTKNSSELVDDMEYRIYIKDGTREVDIVPYEKVHKSFIENYILIDTSMLIPQRYYIDIKFKYNLEMIMHHDIMEFDIIDDLNNKYN